MTLRDAFEEASRLGHQWVGADHVLLALVREDRPSTARAVLAEQGLTHREVERRFVRGLLNAQPPVRSTVSATDDGVVVTPLLQARRMGVWLRRRA